MIRQVFSLTRANYGSADVVDYLDHRFQIDSHEGFYPTTTIRISGPRSSGVSETIHPLDYGYRLLNEYLPEDEFDRFHFLVRSTDRCIDQSQVGRHCLRNVWPTFFDSFPDGRILVYEMEKDWFTSLWRGQHALAIESSTGHDFDLDIEPQRMSGLQSDNLPVHAFQLAAYSIYPLILFDFIGTANWLLFVYIPPHPFKYSQTFEAGRYSQIYQHFHHVLDDQWTFDGSRGPKSSADSSAIAPEDVEAFIDWLSTRLSSRMADVQAIRDVIKREIVGLTFNRAVCDSVFAATQEFPYLAKTFFFGTIDKLSNLCTRIGCRGTETDIWKQLVSVKFLDGKVLPLMSAIPGAIGQRLSDIVAWTVQLLDVEELDESLLRTYRNTYHGYALKDAAVRRLFQHSGEINNDITMVTVPLSLWLINQSWLIESESQDGVDSA